jgi:hypothetical protein
MGKVITNVRNFRDSYHVGNRLPRNPFDPLQSVEKLEWCGVCKMDVDVQVEAANADGVDVYRKRCLRCGGIIQFGIARRHLTSGKPIPAAAVKFIRRSGRDRR